MKPCSSCDRHIGWHERACPTCGTPARGVTAPILAVSLALVLVGCTVRPAPPTTASGGSGTTTAASSTTTSNSGTGVITTTSTGPGTTTANDDTTTGPLTTVGFVECGDCGSGAFHCDLFEQDCPDQEKCVPWSNDGGFAWNDTRCSPLFDQPAQLGEPCEVEGNGVTGIDSCALGLLCWYVDPDTNLGTCVSLCDGSLATPSCEDLDTVCSISNFNGVGVDPVLPLCLDPCAPLLQDCPGDQACYPVADDWVCGPDASVGMGTHRAPCDFTNICGPGFVCADQSAGTGCGNPFCCTQLCDIDDVLGDAQCPGMPEGQQCLPWYEPGMAPAGYESVGVCTSGGAIPTAINAFVQPPPS